MFPYSTIGRFHLGLSRNEYSCVETVRYYLTQIEKNSRLNAFTAVYSAESLEKAARLDEKRKRGEPLKRLHGVIIAIKDVICYRDHPVTAASKILERFTSLYSATVVERLLEEDAIIIGSCNCDEFAMGSTNENSAYGRVLNALDETKVPGGSSGGSAVAVQAGMCMAALGSDTGGSVRQPADFCGILGFKPTYGAISRYGLVAYASSFDQIGILANSTEDISLLFDVMNGSDEYDSTALPGKISAFPLQVDAKKKYRIAYFRDALDHRSLDVEIGRALTATLEELKTAGHLVEAVDFSLIDYVVPAYYVLTTAEASSNLGRYDGIRFGLRADPEKPIENIAAFYNRNRSKGFGTEVKRRIMLGTFVLSAGYYDAYYRKAQQVRRMLVESTNQLFRDYDAIILPTCPSTAFPLGDNTNDPVAVYLADIFTVFANLCGLPAISLPFFKHSNGMPFGLQVMTNKKDDVTLLQLAAYLIENNKSRKMTGLI